MNEPKSPRKRARARAAGHPTGDAVVGRAAIIDAAASLMRSKSPQALSVSEVAASAGVDPALIRYYFVNKQGLMRATAAHLLQEIQARSRLMLDEQGTLEDRVRRRLRMLIEALRDNPRFLQLVLNEVYAADASPDSQQILQDVAFKGVALSEAILHDGDGLRAETDDIDPRFLHVAMLGMCTFFMDAQPMLKVLFGPAAQVEDRFTDQYVDFATKLILQGIVPRD